MRQMWELEQSGMTPWFWLNFNSTPLLGTWGRGKRKRDRKWEEEVCMHVCRCVTVPTAAGELNSDVLYNVCVSNVINVTVSIYFLVKPHVSVIGDRITYRIHFPCKNFNIVSVKILLSLDHRRGAPVQSCSNLSASKAVEHWLWGVLSLGLYLIEI